MREDEDKSLCAAASRQRYNTVLNLVRKYTDEEMRAILRKNFATFQGERQRERCAWRWSRPGSVWKRSEREDADGKARRRRGAGCGRWSGIWPSCLRRSSTRWSSRPSGELLEELDYIRDGRLTARGEFAAMIDIQELLVTELFFAGWFHQLDEDQINALAVSVDYEPRKSEGKYAHNVFDIKAVEGHVKRLAELEARAGGRDQRALQRSRRAAGVPVEPRRGVFPAAAGCVPG